jgi:hypothetical protein
MKQVSLLFTICILVVFNGCTTNKSNMENKEASILFLHHSTGFGVWRGETNRYIYKLTKKGDVEKIIDKHNKEKGTNYTIKEQAFPKGSPYEWKNYPFDYYNIWVKNGGESPYMKEPTLEMLTKQYDVIVIKHCFPVSSIQPDTGSADINSELKTVANYKVQYLALKEKLKSFPDTKFIVWTGAALTQASTSEDEAKRAYDFFNWVKNEWDEPNDNIYIWDFRELETEGGLYLKDVYASLPNDSHPNMPFNAKSAKLFVSRLTDIIENSGSKTNLLGEKI